MRKQLGFTLIELMIVVAIIAILAAIAINQYQDYVIRSQLGEASTLADGVKSNIGIYYTFNGSFPPTNSTANLALSASITGQYVSDLDVGNPPGTITVKMGNKSSAGLAGKTLLFSAVTNAGSIEWHCISTNLKPKWCSSTCKCTG